MKKSYLPLLVVALFMSLFLWLLESETVGASGEGGNPHIIFDQPNFITPIKYTSPIELRQIIENSNELAKKVDELEKRIQELEIELEKYRVEEVSVSVNELDAEYVINNFEYELYELTAYTNHFQSTGKREGDPYYGITASGEKTEEGVTIAADWKVLPKGTVVYIDGVGFRTVQDKGGAIKNRKIDVFFESEEVAKQFGRKKNVKVYVVKLGGS